MEIRGTTTLYGIVGQPVAHSLSPLFQNWFLNQHHIDAAYLPLPVDRSTNIARALTGLHSCGIAGLNVTVPYKELVARVVTCDSDALAIGAVNTVRRTSDGWQGCNTDHIGIQQVVIALLKSTEGCEIVLFGAGGTARAVLHGCNQLGIKRIWLCNRTQQRAEELALHAEREHYQTTITPIQWQQQEVDTACQRAALIINTTTIGLHNRDPFPFTLPPWSGADHGAAIDAVYSDDGSTSFTTMAASHNRRTLDGLPLLIAQGAASFYYWHQLSIDRQQALDYICQKLQRPPSTMNGWGGE
ncbi:MAG: shikimate dehydrogenase [Mariprofundales bacterium]|nr:shikimate dehydrogenase [Mariprofundales bacterium]